jgi:hypothetical protein
VDQAGDSENAQWPSQEITCGDLARSSE